MNCPHDADKEKPRDDGLGVLFNCLKAIYQSHLQAVQLQHEQSSQLHESQLQQLQAVFDWDVLCTADEAGAMPIKPTASENNPIVSQFISNSLPCNGLLLLSKLINQTFMR